MSSKYKDIVREIECEILSGTYRNNNKLPTEEELINKFNVSRTTIRKAINLLANRGYVYPVQGSGIFIREAALHDYINFENLNGLTRDYPNKKIGAKIIRLETLNATAELAEKFQCKEGTELYFLERARYVDGEPFAIEYTYFNKNIVYYLDKKIAEKSIYSYITNDLKYTIGFADKIIYADKLNKESSEILGLKENDPAIIVENKTFLGNGNIFEVSTAIHNYKLAKFLKLANYNL